VAPASADITLQMKARGQMLGTVAEDATEYRKGLKVRTDSTSSGVSTSTIIDLSKGRIGFKGNEPASRVMEAGTYTIEVSSVSTAPIPDSMFDIPADYTVTKR
jgi:hypothetical protein